MSVKDYVSRVTKDNEQPPDGTILYHLVKMADQGKSSAIMKQLANRLKKNSIDVKIKALISIKHLLSKCSTSLARDVKAHVDIIKAHVDYTAPKDPLHGYRKINLVNTLAKQILEMAYDDTSSKTRTGGISQRNMQGVGNTYVEPKKSKSLSRRAFGSVSSKIKSTVNYTPFQAPSGGLSTASNVDLQVASIESNWGDLTKSTSRRRRSSKNFDYSSPANQVDNREMRYASSLSGGGGQYTPSSAIGGGMQYTPNYGGSGGMAQNAGESSSSEDDEYERGLIDAVLEFGGVSTRVDSGKLREFLSKARTLDVDVVGPILEEKIATGDLRVSYRAAYILSKLLEMDHEYVEFFSEEEGKEIIVEWMEKFKSNPRCRSLGESILSRIDPTRTAKPRDTLIFDMASEEPKKEVNLFASLENEKSSKTELDIFGDLNAQQQDGVDIFQSLNAGGEADDGGEEFDIFASLNKQDEDEGEGEDEVFKLLNQGSTSGTATAAKKKPKFQIKKDPFSDLLKF